MHLAETIFKAQSTAVVVLDALLQVKFLNPAAELLLEISKERAHTKSVIQILGAEEAVAEVFRKSLSGGESYTLRELELTPQHTDLVTVVDCAVSVIADEPGEALLLELWRVDSLVKLSRDSWRSENRQATQQMIRGLAHEIKNPLGGLRGAAQLLARELKNADLTEYTDIVIHEADRLSNLVDRMTAPYKQISRERLNPHEVLEYVYKLIKAEEQGRINLERDYDPSLPEIDAERDGLTQVFLNIIRNAAQAIPEQGTIILRTRIGRRHSIGGKVFRQVIRVEIVDDGPGVSKELEETLFFPMVTDRAEGTGLGLSIAQDIVIRHGGSIEFHSQPGETCFLVIIPVDTDRPE